MPHPKFGDKFSCFSCGAKFYNMKKPESICPQCGSNQDKAPKKRGMKFAKPPAPAPTEEFEAEEEPASGDEIETLPLQNQDEEESFDPNKNPISADETPDQDF